MTDKLYTECAFYPGSNTLAVINNSGEEQSTAVRMREGEKTFSLRPFETLFVKI